MLMSDVKRLIRLLPSSYQARWMIILAVTFPVLGVFMSLLSDDMSDLSLPLFYCAYPVFAVAGLGQRVEIPFLVRTSPHRKRMVTAATVFLQALTELIMWALVLFVIRIAANRIGMTQPYQLLHTVWYLVLVLMFCLVGCFSQKLSGPWLWIYTAVVVAIVIAGMLWFPTSPLAERLFLLSEDAFRWVNALSLTAVAVSGTLVSAVICYAIVRMTDRHMISNTMMERIKG